MFISFGEEARGQARGGGGTKEERIIDFRVILNAVEF